MAAAKEFKFNYASGVPGGDQRKAQFAKIRNGSVSRTDPPPEPARGPATGDPVVSVSGEPLPKVVVRALTAYVPTQFRPKTKDELLAMLVNAG
jgi:hypothetical protein